MKASAKVGLEPVVSPPLKDTAFAVAAVVAVAAFTIPFFIRNTISPVATCNPPCEPGFVCTDGICFVGGGGI